MEKGKFPGRRHHEVKLPPPPPLPSDMAAPQGSETPRLTAMSRTQLGRVGTSVRLYSNHFRVAFSNLQHAYHYNVTISHEHDGTQREVVGKGMRRKIMDKVKEIYGNTELDGKHLAYDGEKSMFTIGPLSRNIIECTVVIDYERGSGRPIGDGSPSEMDRKKTRREKRGETFKVEIAFAAQISMKTLQDVIRGEVSDNAQDALRVLDIILRQHASRKGYLLVRQSFFHWNFAPLVQLGGGLTGCRGYHISFRPIQKGLSLNMDVSTTILIKAGSVINILFAHQGVSDPRSINWTKAKQFLKGLRIKTKHTNRECKISGLSDKICKEQLFPMKVRAEEKRENEPPQIVEVTVFDYFANTKQIPLASSGDLPCLDVGRKKRPNYLPVELCEILPGQRYTKALPSAQRTALVKETRQNPNERIQVLTRAMQVNDYNSDPCLRACSINVDKHLTNLDGRVLDPPRLKFGKTVETPRNGRWNYNHKTMFRPKKIDTWAIVNFSSNIRSDHIERGIRECCESKGMEMAKCMAIKEERPQDKTRNPFDRVERMLNQLKADILKPPQFLLCILPQSKTCDLYGPWKKKFMSDMGVVNQCIAPSPEILNNQYFTNVALKINVKLGGLNSALVVEYEHRMPKISEIPTIILGMGVSHGSPGHGDSPSISAVVGSREWPLISKYRASVRTQPAKVEMIEALHKRLPNGKDVGMIRELLLDFHSTCKPPPEVQKKPQQMIIFRDGVSETQFEQVLNVELRAILKACNDIEDGYRPKVTLIVAQKNHHTKLFPTGQGNVQPGTIVDTQICHPRRFDFYLCPQNGAVGTSRPTHYHVLLDENSFTVDDIQSMVHVLSYVYQKSTTAISSVAPINYAHLAATQMQQLLKAVELSETASRSGRGEGSVASGGHVPELPALHENICHTMFFC